MKEELYRKMRAVFLDDIQASEKNLTEVRGMLKDLDDYYNRKKSVETKHEPPKSTGTPQMVDENVLDTICTGKSRRQWEEEKKRKREEEEERLAKMEIMEGLRLKAEQRAKPASEAQKQSPEKPIAHWDNVPIYLSILNEIRQFIEKMNGEPFKSKRIRAIVKKSNPHVKRTTINHRATGYVNHLVKTGELKRIKPKSWVSTTAQQRPIPQTTLPSSKGERLDFTGHSSILKNVCEEILKIPSDFTRRDVDAILKPFCAPHIKKSTLRRYSAEYLYWLQNKGKIVCITSNKPGRWRKIYRVINNDDKSDTPPPVPAIPPKPPKEKGMLIGQMNKVDIYSNIRDAIMSFSRDFNVVDVEQMLDMFYMDTIDAATYMVYADANVKWLVKQGNLIPTNTGQGALERYRVNKSEPTKKNEIERFESKPLSSDIANPFEDLSDEAERQRGIEMRRQLNNV